MSQNMTAISDANDELIKIVIHLHLESETYIG